MIKQKEAFSKFSQTDLASSLQKPKQFSINSFLPFSLSLPQAKGGNSVSREGRSF